jgi:hypothetical protein
MLRQIDYRCIPSNGALAFSGVYKIYSVIEPTEVSTSITGNGQQIILSK